MRNSPVPTDVVVTIERKDEIELRYQITVGTDLSGWELIKTESSNSDSPFQRIYVLVQARGEGKQMRGLSFYEGSFVEIDYGGLVDNNTINNLVNVTWDVAHRQVEVYNDYLKSISEGPLFKNDPVLTRPDLPNPDTTP